MIVLIGIGSKGVIRRVIGFSWALLIAFVDVLAELWFP